MKVNNDYHYSSIDSFEDLKLEKARLILKSKLLESKLELNLINIRQSLSFGAIAASVARKFLPEDIYSLVERVFNG